MTTALLPPPTTLRTPAPPAGAYRFTRAEYHRMGELGFFEGATGYQSKQTLGDCDSISPLAAPSGSIRVADLLP